MLPPCVINQSVIAYGNVIMGDYNNTTIYVILGDIGAPYYDKRSNQTPSTTYLIHPASA